VHPKKIQRIKILKDQNPLVSVIIPVYNGEQYLAEAVGSAQSQTYLPVEIIVIDDGSTDATVQVAKQFSSSIRYYYQSNSGAAAARNQGIRIAKGDYFAFLDADDLWPEDKLQVQISRFVKNPELEVVLGRIQYVRLPGAGEIRIQLEQDDTLAYVHLGSGLYKKTVFDRIGGFDETLHFSEDHDWFLRAREQRVKMTILDQVTLYYRLHQNNMTRDNKRIIDLHMVKALKKSLDRRRAKDGEVHILPKFYEYDESKHPNEGK
jgi:glycosyltransferase involved in cell wall biosynthesis